MTDNLTENLHLRRDEILPREISLTDTWAERTDPVHLWALTEYWRVETNVSRKPRGV
jgi:hypothetical protein